MIETLFAEEARWPVLIGMLLGTVKRLGVGNYSQVGGGIGIEQMSGPEAELAVEDGAADLEQEIGTAARPSHLPRLVHNGEGIG